MTKPNEIRQQFLTGERALFHARDLNIYDTIFDDGESPLKESRNIELWGSMFRWKYPLWYCKHIKAHGCTWFEMARAGVWYTDDILVEDAVIEAPKNFRRCHGLTLRDVQLPNAAETLWSCQDVVMENVSANVTFQYKKLLGYRRGEDGNPEIVPEEAETVRRIFRRYLEGASLGDIKKELEVDNIPTSEGVKGWSYQVIQNILTNEKYIGDALLLKTYVTDPISKKVVKNLGDQPMYYVENNHPAIIPKEIFNRAKEEIARRASKRKVMQKRGKTEQGKYSARYALSELLVCGECGMPYKRCTWARNGKKRIVWRCVSRLEFGTKYCHSSPTLDEDRLHRAIVAALNEYGAVRQEIQENAMELAGMAQDYGVGGSDLLALRRRLDELTAAQALLLDKVLEDMDNLDLNAQLKALAEEKQGILEQMAALQEKAERQALQASRRRELEDWLGQQPMMFTEYDDSVTRRLVERITVADAETIRVKLRDTDVEIEQRLC